MRGKGNKKAINDARDIGGRNKISEVMELVAKNELEYDNIINDKPGYDNDRANELLVDAIKNLNSLVSETRQTISNASGGIESAKIYSKIAELHMKKGDYQKALSELETANLAVKTPENYKNMAKCKERQGQIEEAHEFYKDALEVANKPDKGNENKREKNIMKAGIYLDRGKLWMSQRKYLNAKKDFDDAILISDSKVDAQLSAELFLERGKCSRELMKYKESIDDLDAAVSKLGKSNIPKRYQAQAHNELGFSYHENGQFEKALEHYNKAIEINRDGAAFYVNRGLSLKHLGDQYQDQALEDFQKAIDLNPNDPRPYFNRGTIYCSKQDYEAAHQDYDRAIELTAGIPEYSNFSTFHHAKGLAYSDQRDFESAKKYFQKAITKNPVSVQSIFHLGLVEHELKELTKALEAFTEVINTNRENERVEDRLAYESRGLVYYDMKNFVKALEDFNKAIELHDDYPECYYYRGLTLNKLGSYPDAIEDFMRALELKSRFEGSIYNGLGFSYNKLKDFSKALHVIPSDQAS